MSMDEQQVLEAGRIVDVEVTDALRAASLRRRAVLALYDLGLLDVVGRDWCLVGGAGGLEFAPLVGRSADRLVRALEDLAPHVPSRKVEPGPGQLSLFEL